MTIEKFCETYVGLAGDIAGLAWYFLVASLAVAVAAALLDLWAKLTSKPPAGGAKLTTTGAPAGLKEVVGALKDLITALASAPAWLALFALGIVTFWVPGDAVGQACPKEQQAPPTKPSQQQQQQQQQQQNAGPGTQKGTTD